MANSESQTKQRIVVVVLMGFEPRLCRRYDTRATAACINADSVATAYRQRIDSVSTAYRQRSGSVSTALTDQLFARSLLGLRWHTWPIHGGLHGTWPCNAP